MRSTGFPAALILASAAVLVAPAAHADAPCNTGIRASTPAERATMTAVLQAAKRALPPAPAGWQVISGDEITPIGNICRDGEKRPWSYEFNRSYRQVGDYEMRSKAMNEAAAYAAAEQKKKQPRMDALMAQMTKLSERQIALVQKGDMAGAEKINHEMVKVQAEYKKVADEGDSQARIAAAGKEMNRDLEMSISVQINPGAEAPETGAQSLPLPVGAFAAYRWDTSDENADTGHALILYGKWIRNAQGRWMPVGRANVAATAANAMAVKVTADPNRLASLLQSIDFQGLSTALAK